MKVSDEIEVEVSHLIQLQMKTFPYFQPWVALPLNCRDSQAPQTLAGSLRRLKFTPYSSAGHNPGDHISATAPPLQRLRDRVNFSVSLSTTDLVY